MRPCALAFAFEWAAGASLVSDRSGLLSSTFLVFVSSLLERFDSSARFGFGRLGRGGVGLGVERRFVSRVRGGSRLI